MSVLIAKPFSPLRLIFSLRSGFLVKGISLKRGLDVRASSLAHDVHPGVFVNVKVYSDVVLKHFLTLLTQTLPKQKIKDLKVKKFNNYGGFL